MRLPKIDFRFLIYTPKKHVLKKKHGLKGKKLPKGFKQMHWKCCVSQFELKMRRDMIFGI